MAKRILVIDDEEQDRKAMAVALKREGYTDVLCAATAKEALDSAKSSKPDLVVIDVVLSDADGFDVCSQLACLKQENTKILMITGHLDAVNAEKARHSHADELIVKVPGFSNLGQAAVKLIGK